MSKKIKSLAALKKWNESPTEELPMVMDWYLDWFFDKMLEKNDYALFLEALHAAMEFDSICNKKHTFTDSKRRVYANLKFWSNRASKPKLAINRFNRFFKKVGTPVADGYVGF